MADRFPHLSDPGNFPGLDNVDVYAIPEFDYERWSETPKARVKLLNVNWCGDYENVVDFGSDETRDAWFDSAPGEVVEVDTASHYQPSDSIRLPLPLDQVRRFNYMVLEQPVFTGDQPVDYETKDGYRRWFYFIDGARALAPSTVELAIVEDVWTSYINHVRVEYMILGRGHYPLARTNVDDYFSDPLGNSSLLLAPDVDAGGGVTKVGGSAFFPVQADSEKYAVFAIACEPSELRNLGSTTTARESAASYYDISGDTYGASAGVSGYGWAGNGRDYTNVTTPVTNVGSYDGRTPGAVWFVACASSVIFGSDALETALYNYPSFANVIKACYIIPRELLAFSGTVSAMGIDFNVVVGTNPHVDCITPTPDDFGIPHPANLFAKSYTYPYSWIELSTPQGTPVTIRIENLSGDPEIVTNLLLSEPVAQIIQYIDGIGSDVSHLLDIVQLDGSSSDSYYTDSLIAQTLQVFGVDTFAINWSASDSDYLANYNRKIRIPRNSQTEGYRVTARSANASRAMTNATNATARTNAGNTASNIRSNAAASVACSNTIASNAISASTQTNDNNNTAVSGNASTSNSVIRQNTKIDNTATSSYALLNGIQGVVSNMSLDNPNVLGAVLSPIFSAANAAVTIDANSDRAEVQQNANLIYSQITQTQNTRNTSTANDATSSNTSASNSLTSTTASNNASLATTNANNTANTSDSNATISRDVAIDNAHISPLGTAQYNARREYMDSRNGKPGAIGSNGGDLEWSALGWKGTQIRYCTQSDAALMQAASAFGRYGYFLNQAIEFEGFSNMECFDYWQCSDLWLVGDDGVIEGAQNVLKSILKAGVTVWRDPDKIGSVSIWDNIHQG